MVMLCAKTCMLNKHQNYKLYNLQHTLSYAICMKDNKLSCVELENNLKARCRVNI